jgi:hypothetical protein
MKNIDNYLPKVVMPMLRKVTPSLIRATDIHNNGIFPLPSNCNVKDWDFISRNKLKRTSIKNMKYDKLAGALYIIKLILDDTTGIPTHYLEKRVETIDQFLETLGEYAMLHGIVKINKGTIWVKEVNDVSELNIDHKILDRFVARLKKVGFGK